jgi:hypothetical protein
MALVRGLRICQTRSHRGSRLHIVALIRMLHLSPFKGSCWPHPLTPGDAFWRFSEYFESLMLVLPAGQAMAARNDSGGEALIARVSAV